MYNLFLRNVSGFQEATLHLKERNELPQTSCNEMETFFHILHNLINRDYNFLQS